MTSSSSTLKRHGGGISQPTMTSSSRTSPIVTGRTLARGEGGANG